jgi:Flp pilus assembly protein TadD
MRLLRLLGFGKKDLPIPEESGPAGVPPAHDDTVARMKSQARSDISAGRLQDALALLNGVLDTHHDDGELHLLVGKVHERSGQREDAVDAYLLATCYPQMPAEAHFRLGVIAAEDGLREDAIGHFSAAVDVDALHVEAWNYLGKLHLELNRVDEAEHAFRAATEARPEFPLAWTNLAYVLHEYRSAFDEALSCTDEALRLQPDLMEAHCNRSMVMQALGRSEDALVACDAALAKDPAHPESRVNRSLALLMLGRFAEGWEDYQWRKNTYQCFRYRPFSVPEWEGEDASGRTLLVYGEQGLGDEIMFASCFGELMSRSGHCVIDCHPKLEGLFRRSFPGATIHGGLQTDRDLSWVDGMPKMDAKVASGSLPMYFRRRLEDFPRHEGYLVADRERVDRWRVRLAELGPGLKVGLSWRGGSKYTHRTVRSIDLERLLPVLQVPGVSFVSLQYTDCVEEVERLEREHGIRVHHWREALEDYEETAALTVALDLVISVQTAVVHLSGALGRPVWTLVSAAPEWRYQRRGESMPWYPSVRLFRQEHLGEWKPVIGCVADELLAHTRRSQKMMAAPCHSTRSD